MVFSKRDPIILTSALGVLAIACVVTIAMDVSTDKTSRCEESPQHAKGSSNPRGLDQPEERKENKSLPAHVPINDGLLPSETEMTLTEEIGCSENANTILLIFAKRKLLTVKPKISSLVGTSRYRDIQNRNGATTRSIQNNGIRRTDTGRSPVYYRGAS